MPSDDPNVEMDGLRRIDKLPAPPSRPHDAHKGTYGSVLIVAGSEGMSGAACLAGRAALHGGAGLVTVASPRRILPIVAAAHPSYMTLPLEEDGDGRLASRSISRLERTLAKQTSVAIGPGLGLSDGVRHVVQHIYATCRLPLVVDADGLNAFVGDVDELGIRVEEAPRILTPHPGEFARLTNLDTKSIQANREKHAVNFAKCHGVVLLLKGARTIVTDGNQLAINLTGNSGMATGGSGDVLTGLLASLLAQGMSPFSAAQLGAYLHGLAGDLATSALGDRYLTSADLLDYLSAAWLQLSADSS